MIARLNKPQSLDYNPVHKDIYEVFDKLGVIPKMINVWIPVCGVNKTSGLPIAPRSHLISEHKIKRSKAGSVLNSQKYSVNSILEWQGSRDLVRMNPDSDEFLIFSSHLIHGLAFNQNSDKTRISFEFRLCLKE
jgi:ectoine hydroxylase-related dioxygenase (phytanoyl-CoA dioxygenase family)